MCCHRTQKLGGRRPTERPTQPSRPSYQPRRKLMFSRKQSYETSNQGSSLDDLSRKLAVDLRKHVRKLDHYPPYTNQGLWR